MYNILLSEREREKRGKGIIISLREQEDSQTTVRLLSLSLFLCPALLLVVAEQPRLQIFIYLCMNI